MTGFHRWKGAPAALAALLLLCLASRVAWPLIALPLHVSWNNNEGWNAYWSARALAGQPLYTDAASPISNNYPPLSFYLVGWFGRLIGDPVIGGRLLCLAGLLTVAAIIQRIVTRIGASVWGWFAAGVFLLYIAVIAPRYIAANDPQWLAEAVMMAALPLLIGRGQAMARPAAIVGAALLMLTAGLIKHNQVALPIAVTLWLAVYDRRALAVWLATCAVAGGVALIALKLLFGPPFFDQVLHHQRVISLALGVAGLKTLVPLLPEMGLAVWLTLQRPRDPRAVLLLLFAALAVPLGLMERMGAGVSSNAHFDAAIALALVAGAALGRIAPPLPARRLWIAMLALPLMIGSVASAPGDWRRARSARTTAAAWSDAARLIAAQRGPALCERPALCYWSGKPYALDAFNYGQKMKKGHDPAGLRAGIADQDYGAIVETRNRNFLTGGRLPVDVYRLIDAHYRTAMILPDKIYVLVRRG